MPRVSEQVGGSGESSNSDHLGDGTSLSGVSWGSEGQGGCSEGHGLVLECNVGSSDSSGCLGVVHDDGVSLNAIGQVDIGSVGDSSNSRSSNTELVHDGSSCCNGLVTEVSPSSEGGEISPLESGVLSNVGGVLRLEGEPHPREESPLVEILELGLGVGLVGGGLVGIFLVGSQNSSGKRVGGARHSCDVVLKNASGNSFLIARGNKTNIDGFSDEAWVSWSLSFDGGNDWGVGSSVIGVVEDIGIEVSSCLGVGSSGDDWGTASGLDSVVATSSLSEGTRRGQSGLSNSGVSNSLHDVSTSGSADGGELWALHELGEWDGGGPCTGSKSSGELSG